MDTTNIPQTVSEILSDQLGLDHEDITLEKNIIADLGADSLDTVEIVMALEEDFSIDIPDEDVFNRPDADMTVGDLIGYIERRIA